MKKSLMVTVLSFLVMLFAAIPLSAAQTIKISAVRGETATSFWVEKGSVIQFSLSGSWTMWERWNPVDYRGHLNYNKINKYYLGALIGRVEGGQNFEVKDNMTYKSPVSGKLILYPNRGNYKHLKASGSINVTISGAKEVSTDKAEELSGWDINKLDTAKNASYLTRAEKDVILIMNKARSNPPLFARQYLESRKNDNAYAKELYNEMLVKKPMGLLSPSKALYKSSRDHAADMGRTGKTGHTGTDGSSMSRRINRYGSWGGSISENCSYGYNDPMGIVLQLLIDNGVTSRGHRKNIFSTGSRYVGVSIEPHKRYRYNCVQDFAGSITDK